MAYPWPGNVRELQNRNWAGRILAPTAVSHRDRPSLYADFRLTVQRRSRPRRPGRASDATRQRLYKAILQDGGFDLEQHRSQLLELTDAAEPAATTTHAAKLLGITRRQLAYRHGSRGWKADWAIDRGPRGRTDQPVLRA